MIQVSVISMARTSGGTAGTAWGLTGTLSFCMVSPADLSEFLTHSTEIQESKASQGLGSRTHVLFLLHFIGHNKL